MVSYPVLIDPLRAQIWNRRRGNPSRFSLTLRAGRGRWPGRLRNRSRGRPRNFAPPCAASDKCTL